MLQRFTLPAVMPAKKIISVDIGGTLAKAAFYLPRDDPMRQDLTKYEALTSECIPSKYSVQFDQNAILLTSLICVCVFPQ